MQRSSGAPCSGNLFSARPASVIRYLEHILHYSEFLWRGPVVLDALRALDEPEQGFYAVAENHADRNPGDENEAPEAQDLILACELPTYSR